MFKAVHAITAAVPFRATAPSVSAIGVPRHRADAGTRPALRAHWVRVVSAAGVPSLALRWDSADSATCLDPDAPVPVPVPVLPFAA